MCENPETVETPRLVRRMPSQPSEYSVATSAGALLVHAWVASTTPPNMVIVTVHPWAPLGGGEHNTVGYGKALPEQIPGTVVLTFNMRSSSMVWGVLSGHRSEVAQVKAVCEWAQKTWSNARLLLLGSSAGAPVAGSALDATAAAGAIFIGYTFGRLSSIAFGSHFGGVLRSTKPKFFLMGENDEFTSPTVLQAKVASSKGKNAMHIFPDVGHFELERSDFDEELSSVIAQWLTKTWPVDTSCSSASG